MFKHSSISISFYCVTLLIYKLQNSQKSMKSELSKGIIISLQCSSIDVMQPVVKVLREWKLYTLL